MHYQKILKNTQKILSSLFVDRQVAVYLFGSFAHKKTHCCSDIDIGILPRKPLPLGLLPHIREGLEESNIPLRIDLVDLSRTSQKFRNAVIREGIRWNL